jgi:hypothetical protein
MPKTTIAGQPPQRIIKHVSWFAKKIHQVITSQHSGRPERIVRGSKNEVHDNHPDRPWGIPYLRRRIYRPRGVDGMDRLRLKVSKDLGVEAEFLHLNLFGLI